MMDFGFFYRIRESLADGEMRTLADWYMHTGSSFSARMKKFEKEIEKIPREELDRELMDGYSVADRIDDEYTQIVSASGLTERFAVLSAFSIFERFMLSLYQDVRDFGLIIPEEFALKDKEGNVLKSGEGNVRYKRWLELDGYKEVLKANGIVITKPPVEWDKLLKLRDIRNAVAHHDGQVTEENMGRLEKYGYKLGDYVEVSEEYVCDAIVLVMDSVKKITELSTPTFQKLFQRQP